MDDADIPFWKLVCRYGAWAVTGSILAVIWTLLNAFVTPLPSWAAWVFLVSGIILSIYVAGNYTHGQRSKLAERLKPRLEITGVGPHSHDHRRITVHNKTAKKIKFRARLLKTTPNMVNYQFPVDLQPMHCQGNETLGEIGPDSDQPVDVFIDGPIPSPLPPFPPPPSGQTREIELDTRNQTRLKLMGAPPCLLFVPRDQRLELYIGVYPVDEEGGIDRRWFYIVPQADGSVVFTADGRNEGLRPG